MFVVNAKKFEFLALDPEDGRAISDAWDIISVLGEDYLTVEELLYHAKHHIAVGAFHRDELTGVVIAHPLSPGDFKTLERRMGKGRGPGIGSRLLGEAEGRLKDSGCEVVFAESWVSGLGDESKNLAPWVGYEFKFEVPGYWSSDGVYYPICESGDCKCTALICLKLFNKNGAVDPVRTRSSRDAAADAGECGMVEYPKDNPQAYEGIHMRPCCRGGRKDGL